jgi:phosphoribosylformimino-5-aminoimidazole carboxamide ribotide isomerase
MEIIPAIDCIGGKCVRLTQGDYAQKTVYHDDPLEVALQFEAAGIKRLHLVDLDGAKAGKVVNWKVLERIALHTSLDIDFGGGIKKEEDLKKVMDSGAKWAVIGSLAVKEPILFTQWIKKYGSETFFLGADVRKNMIAVSGWQETTDTGILDFIDQYYTQGIEYIFCTDISKDGKLEGPAVELYRDIIAHNKSIRLVASGGVSRVEDLYVLQSSGCAGVIIGKAIYENRISLADLKPFLP